MKILLHIQRTTVLVTIPGREKAIAHVKFNHKYIQGFIKINNILLLTLVYWILYPSWVEFMMLKEKDILGGTNLYKKSLELW